MLKSLKLVSAVSALVLMGGFSSWAEVFRSFATLPTDATPGRALLQGQDGYLYGVLEFTEAFSSNAQTMGALYRISPLGEFSYIRRYPFLGDVGNPNDVGTEPTSAFAQGVDGYLYGLTNYGGALGNGVFYRTSPDGTEYQSITHLTFDVNPYMLGADFVQAAPNTFFAYHILKKAILRYSPEGVSVVQDAGSIPAELALNGPRLFTPEGVGGPLAMAWASAQNDIHIRLLDGNTGAFISEEVITTFTGATGRVGVLNMKGGEIVALHSPGTPQAPLPHRLVVIAPDRTDTEIAQFKADPSDTTRLETPKQFLFAKDGSFYFTAGEQNKGLLFAYGGTEVYHLTREGVARKVSDLGGYPLSALCEGKDEFFYGVSWGPTVDFEPTPEEPAADATTEQNASARHAVRAPAKISRTRHGAFKISRRSAELSNHLPLAKRDAVVLSRAAAGKGAATNIRPLLNDRDPERTKLSIKSVETPTAGTVELSPDGKLVYVPARVPAASDRFAYTVQDEQGAESVGTISIRGDVQGMYRMSRANPPTSSSQEITLNALKVKIAKLGGVIATAKIDGKPVLFRGKLDFSDKATLTKRLKDGTLMTLSVEVVTTDDAKRALTYRIAKGDLHVEGTLAR